MIFLVFTFFNFLFYRIMTAGMFDDPMSIIACLLVAGVNGFIVFFGTAFGVARAATPTPSDPLAYSMPMAVVSLVAIIAASFGAAWLIALGFSEEFYKADQSSISL